MKTNANAVDYIFLSTDLRRVYDFYSCIGMHWPEGNDTNFGSSGLPLSAEAVPEFPHLIGQLAGIDYAFFLDKNLDKGFRDTRTIMMVCMSSSTDLRRAISRLKSKELFLPSTEYKEGSRWLLWDPDGRQVELTVDFGFVMGMQKPRSSR